MPGSVHVEIDPKQAEVAPGSATRLQVRVVNGTAVVDQFWIVVVGIEEHWAPGPQQVSLLPNQEGRAEIVVAVPREQAPQAGRRVIGVKVTSVADPSVSRVEEIALTIGAAPAASLTVQPQKVRGGHSGKLTASVVNAGNVPLRLGLRGEDTEQAVRFRFTPPTLEVPPGERATARVDVSAPRLLTGPEAQRTLTIVAEGGPQPLAVTATFAQRSRVASGLLRGLAGLAGLAVIGGAILGATLLAKGGSDNASASGSTTVTTLSPPVTTVGGKKPKPGGQTATTGGSPTLSTEQGQGQGQAQPEVPDVAGLSAAVAVSRIEGVGLTAQQTAQASNSVAKGRVIRTDPAAGTKLDKGATVQVTVSSGANPTVDLLDAASSAAWSSGAGTLPFNGSDGDDRGFVILRQGFQLEDGSTPARVLETHPQWVADGFIQGDFTLPAPIIQGDRFTSDVGFLAGNIVGEVDFSVLVVDAQGHAQVAGTVHDTAPDQQRRHLGIDLSSFAGAQTIRLRVDAGPTSAQDWAVWIAPKVGGHAGT